SGLNSVAWQASPQVPLPVVISTRWRLVRLGVVGIPLAAAAGSGGGKFLHSSRSAMNTPRWMMSGSLPTEMYDDRKPACVSRPDRRLGSRSTLVSIVGSLEKLPDTP